MIMRCLFLSIAIALSVPAAHAAAPATNAAGPATNASAIVVQDQTALRAAPRDSAQQQALLFQGEVVEVRGARMDYLQVWDHQRERGGYIRATQVRRTGTDGADAAELLGVLRFLRDTAGSEALGIGIAAAWIKAAPAEILAGTAGTEALDALGGFADRLARRASSGGVQSKAAETALAAHLEVALRYGVNFVSFERLGRMQICYDGEAQHRVLALKATPEQQARAALALTRNECVDPAQKAHERYARDQWRAAVLDRVDTAELSGMWKNRVLMHRASIQAGLAYQAARRGEPAAPAAGRALADLALVQRAELTDEDQTSMNDSAMRVNASRWAALPALAPAPVGQSPVLLTQPGQPGETCVLLVGAAEAARNDLRNPLLRRCTFGVVWAASANANREGNALALAVQPLDTWRELWVLRKDGSAWSVAVLPPAATLPETGYAEFAGWVPGGRQMLVAREARGEGKYRKSFEVVDLQTLASERQAGDPAVLGPFQRWQDAGWKRHSVSVR